MSQKFHVFGNIFFEAIRLEFELLTLNDKWPNISVDENVKVDIIGKVIQNVRIYL